MTEDFEGMSSQSISASGFCDFRSPEQIAHDEETYKASLIEQERIRAEVDACEPLMAEVALYTRHWLAKGNEASLWMFSMYGDRWDSPRLPGWVSAHPKDFTATDYDGMEYVQMRHKEATYRGYRYVGPLVAPDGLVLGGSQGE
ncbi:hypothetical protein J2D73_18590 [Acetobacter sacchari]|uniref:Uncharacterized protein n=1 Tax=Acetobacter sacchari TaxID=2661687 RepID=A0ABS3M0U8_9PROT|nr:hypothetical protein [Acetobacter sacchari]MBO1361794.1 hypothetical protein [Acetobacter sacchari]